MREKDQLEGTVKDDLKREIIRLGCLGTWGEGRNFKQTLVDVSVIGLLTNNHLQQNKKLLTPDTKKIILSNSCHKSRKPKWTVDDVSEMGLIAGNYLQQYNKFSKQEKESCCQMVFTVLCNQGTNKNHHLKPFLKRNS